jgi:hypothetical protein
MNAFFTGAVKVIKRVAFYIWETFCWLIVPAVFGGLLYASFFRPIAIMQFCIAAVAVSPWLLRFLSSTLSEFSIGPTGVTGKTKEAVRNKDEIEPPPPAPQLILAANDAHPPQPDQFPVPDPELSSQALKVVRTLWKFQVEHFGPDDIRRWGFAVGTGAPDYMEFSLGVLHLLQRQLVNVDGRGFVFLTDAGIQFCKTYNRWVTTFPHYYSTFSN